MILIKILIFIINHPLSQKRKINAIFNFIQWQVSQLLIRKSKTLHWIDNSRLEIKKGNTGLTGNIYVGLAEYNEMGFLLHCLKEEDVFIDIGANAGAYSILSSKVIGANTISFEPISKTIEILMKQIDINNVSKKVQVRSMCLGNQNTPVLISKNLDTTNRIIKSEEINHFQYELVKQSKLDDQVKIDKEFIIKVDVEGYELNVLKGSTDTLKNDKLVAIIIETNCSGKNFGYSDNELHMYLKSYNFEPYTYDPKNRILKKIEKLDSNNTIYIRNLKRVINRIKESGNFCIHTAGSRYL